MRRVARAPPLGAGWHGRPARARNANGATAPSRRSRGVSPLGRLEHHRDWLDAIRKGTKAGSDFAAYGGPLTELAMLGVIAIKLPGTKPQWDAPNMRFTNCPEANQHVNPPCRNDWTL